jgi:hypothetical protein
MTRTLASYLADRQKRERIKQEDNDLAFEERLVEQALNRKARRSGSPKGGRVTREQVFEIVSGSVERHFKASDAMNAMSARGIEVKPESLRQHLRRLVADERFDRDGESYVNPKAPDQPPAASNGSGQATQAFPNPVVAGAGRDREIGTNSGSP